VWHNNTDPTQISFMGTRRPRPALNYKWDELTFSAITVIGPKSTTVKSANVLVPSSATVCPDIVDLRIASPKTFWIENVTVVEELGDRRVSGVVAAKGAVDGRGATCRQSQCQCQALGDGTYPV